MRPLLKHRQIRVDVICYVVGVGVILHSIPSWSDWRWNSGTHENKNQGHNVIDVRVVNVSTKAPKRVEGGRGRGQHDKR